MEFLLVIEESDKDVLLQDSLNTPILELTVKYLCHNQNFPTFDNCVKGVNEASSGAKEL